MQPDVEAELLARNILVSIASHASPRVVLKALEACGAPADEVGLTSFLRAAMDTQETA